MTKQRTCNPKYVRRLAKQSRKDKYPNRKDYQEILKRNPLRAELTDDDRRHSSTLVFKKDLTPAHNDEGEFVGFGAYLKSPRDCHLAVAWISGVPGQPTKSFILRRGWNRIGFAVACNSKSAKIEIRFEPSPSSLLVWGLDVGIVTFPPSLTKEGVTVSEEDLNSEYVCPEGLYLDHSVALNADLVPEESSPLTFRASSEHLEVKKCSYDGRYLPLDSSKPGSLAFHRHKAKRTRHQNECRACKKWRINNSFNPLRTADQLNESSLITRERKIFLREPEILQRIKNRHGEGLKSVIWKRFGKKCFLCNRRLGLSEVEVDHTRPLAYLWPIDIHATCLCAKCNNLKKDRFPIDVYDQQKLRRLSRMTGLSDAELSIKDVNRSELNRVLKDVEVFARSWDPRRLQ